MTLYPSDLLAAALLAIAALRFCLERHRRLRVVGLAAVMLSVILFINLFLGLPKFGLEQAVNEFRYWLLPIAVLLHGLTYSTGAGYAQQIMRAWATAAVVLCALAAYFWLAYYIGLPYPVQLVAETSAYYAVPRVMVSALAMCILIGTFFAWWGVTQLNWSRRWHWALPFLLLTLLMLQHRTIWVAGLVMIAYLLLTSKLARKRLMVAVAVAAVAGAVFLYVTPSSPVAESLTGAVESTTEENSTLSWRLQGWEQLIRPENIGDPVNYLTGLPMGTGWLRFINQQEITAGPHNQFVQLLLRGGVIGLMAVFALFFNLFRRSGYDTLGTAARTALIGVLIYWFTYGTLATDSVVFLLGAALLGRDQRSSSPRRAFGEDLQSSQHPTESI
ncbi:O-antigen ligase family protein [Deinococcus oregonensis]|uniref:O-antigen ligase family protein n=1 Tax=Deinococcus oregonensis TaxID=1805970 RepID=A0ABV6AYZ6_9DEIO